MAADQLEIGGEGQRALRPADRDDLIFDRLAHHLQHARAEFGQLVQEQHAAVRQGDLARVGLVAAPHQPGMADGVVRRAERPVADQGHFRRQLVGDGVNAGHVQRLVDGSCAAGCPAWPRQQGLPGARAGRPSARCGQKTVAFSVTLADVLFEGHPENV